MASTLNTAKDQAASAGALGCVPTVQRRAATGRADRSAPARRRPHDHSPRHQGQVPGGKLQNRPVKGAGQMIIVGGQPGRSSPRDSTPVNTDAAGVRSMASSTLPVGSSASSRVGRLITARAMATRCCSPPDNSKGNFWLTSPKPTQPNSSRTWAPCCAGIAALQF